MDKLQRLKIAIQRKNVLEVKAISFLLPENSVDQEALALAIRSKNKFIVGDVANKTDIRAFDKEILKAAIATKDSNIVKSIIPKTGKSNFDREILDMALNSKNARILYEVSWFLSPDHFTTKVLDRALESGDPDMVRVTVDRISDPNTFLQYRDKIQAAILQSDDIRNLTAQILSRESNRSFDREMQELIIDMYSNVISSHHKKGDLPPQFPMKAFQSSLDLSRFYFSRPEDIDFGSLNHPNRFLLLPVYVYGHAFSALVRKLDNRDEISITFVNLGARPFEKTLDGQYREYIYKPKDALQVIQDHSYNVRLYYPQRAVTVNEAYMNFRRNALGGYRVNVTSRDQKVGNCFLKNIEKGIRYALALAMTKSIDTSFTPDSLRIQNQTAKQWKVKFLQPLHRPGDKPNQITTLELREELIKTLQSKFPQYEKEIELEWSIYKKRKLRTQNNKFFYVTEPRKIKTKEDSPVFEGMPLKDASTFEKFHTFAKSATNISNYSKDMTM